MHLISACKKAAALTTVLAMSAFAQPAKKRVAVFDFNNAAVQGGIEIPFMQTSTPNVGKAAADLLLSRLVQHGHVSVIERSAIDRVIAEQNFSNSDRTDPATAARIGRILNVDVIVLGTITQYSYEDKMTGGGGSRIGGFGGASMSTKHDIKGRVQISVRLVSPDSAEVVKVSQGSGEVFKKGVKQDMRDTRGLMMGGSGVGTPVMNEAMDKAIVELASALETNIAALPARVPVIEGLIADVSESGRLILNVGSKNGLKEGDRLEVLRVGKEVKDPANGRVLMRDDTPLGEALVTKVSEGSAIAQYTGTEKLKIGDAVRSVPKK